MLMGGIRQEAPVGAAVAMGAKEVFAIIAPVPIKPDGDYTNKGLPEIGLRAATGVTIDEILTDNIAPWTGWPVPVHVIRATVEVERSRTIDPGLIRINIAYGYMRAFDVLSPIATVRRDKQAVLMSLSDQIASTRQQIWQKEETAEYNYGNIPTRDADGTLGVSLEAGMNFQSAIKEMRALKAALLGLVECRLSIGGPQSMTADAADWAASWEAHGWDPTNLSDPGPNWPASPWGDIPGFEGYGTPAASLQATPPPGGCPQFL
jgi:hypothetical protein